MKVISQNSYNKDKLEKISFRILKLVCLTHYVRVGLMISLLELYHSAFSEFISVIKHHFDLRV